MHLGMQKTALKEKTLLTEVELKPIPSWNRRPLCRLSRSIIYRKNNGFVSRTKWLDERNPCQLSASKQTLTQTSKFQLTIILLSVLFFKIHHQSYLHFVPQLPLPEVAYHLLNNDSWSALQSYRKQLPNHQFLCIKLHRVTI